MWARVSEAQGDWCNGVTTKTLILIPTLTYNTYKANPTTDLKYWLKTQKMLQV